MEYLKYQDEIEVANQQLFAIGIGSLNRMYQFEYICDDLSDAQYWGSLKLAFTASDNLYKRRKQIRKLFASTRPLRHLIMSEEEHKLFDALPDKIIAYRGMSIKEFESAEYNISWTLDKKVAEFFAYKYRRNFDTSDHQKIVVKAEISKSSIMALWHDREEQEIIIKPSELKQLYPRIEPTKSSE
tara:strand:- start:5649 stop:6203 length:555 start_codon:yes stop_codon:yes gene_type:complete